LVIALFFSLSLNRSFLFLFLYNVWVHFLCFFFFFFFFFFFSSSHWFGGGFGAHREALTAYHGHFETV
jgi:hypothetical protein